MDSLLENDNNLVMEKITFLAPPSLASAARQAAIDDDRDLSSVCRMALRKFLGLSRVKDRGRGRPRKSPVKVL